MGGRIRNGKRMENMEGTEVIEVSNLIETLEISMHAITRSLSPKTLRVKGRIAL